MASLASPLLASTAPLSVRSKGKVRRAARSAVRTMAGPKVGEPVEEGYEEMFPAPRDARRAGVIMHPTSLPGNYGIGDMGTEAYAFVDWLFDAKMQIWQVLPLVPPGRPIPGVREDYWSPYSGQNAQAGNTLLISLGELVKDGLLQGKELPHPYNMRGNVDFGKVAETNEPLINKAARNLVNRPDNDELKAKFIAWRARPEIKLWLDEAALFHAICNEPELLGEDIRSRFRSRTAV